MDEESDWFRLLVAYAYKNLDIGQVCNAPKHQQEHSSEEASYSIAVCSGQKWMKHVPKPQPCGSSPLAASPALTLVAPDSVP